MTYYSESVQTGAAAIRRSSSVSPLEVLSRMREEDPTASYELLLKKWCKYIEAQQEYQDAVNAYAFRNYWTQLDNGHKKANAKAVTGDLAALEERYKASDQRRERVTAEVGKVAAKVSSIVLMNLVLPSGKMLKDSTFRECAEAGEFFGKVAKLGKPNAIVGKTVDEAALRKLWLK